MPRPSRPAAARPAETGGSAPLEHGLALLREGARALLGVLAREDRLPVAGLMAERGVELHAVGLVQRARERLDGEGAVLADHRGDLARLGERLAVGHDVAHQAD